MMLNIRRPKVFFLIATIIPCLLSLQAGAAVKYGNIQTNESSSFTNNAFSQHRIPPGRYLDVQSLIDGLETLKTSPLLVGVQTPKLTLQTQYKDYHVRSSTLIRNNGELGGAFILVTRDNGSFIALVDTPSNRGTVIGELDGTQTFLKEKKYDYLKPDTIIPSAESIAEDAARAIKNGPTVDSTGTYIIDVLAGFSQTSASIVGDPTAYALGQIESANLGLRNSHVDNARLHLAGIEIISTDYPITDDTLSKLYILFKNEVNADLIAGFFKGNSQDTADGWGYVPGRYTVQGIANTTAFRHEVGHNAGGNHCNETGEDNYKFGYNGGENQKTLLCGNNVSFYSTPHAFDIYGRPLGNARTADMARQWREVAPLMSSYGTPPVRMPFHLENRMVRGHCVDVLNGNSETVGVFSCQVNNPNQEWVTDDTGRIRLNSNRNLCLGGNGNNGYVTLQNCNSTDQRILWKESNENYINLSNNQCLNPVAGGISGAYLNLNGCYNTDFQRWLKIPSDTK